MRRQGGIRIKARRIAWPIGFTPPDRLSLTLKPHVQAHQTHARVSVIPNPSLYDQFLHAFFESAVVAPRLIPLSCRRLKPELIRIGLQPWGPIERNERIACSARATWVHKTRWDGKGYRLIYLASADNLYLGGCVRYAVVVTRPVDRRFRGPDIREVNQAIDSEGFIAGRKRIGGFARGWHSCRSRGPGYVLTGNAHPLRRAFSRADGRQHWRQGSALGLVTTG